MRVTSFGELLWDLFPDGARLGGAPANVAFHARRLGAAATLITEVGPDERGASAVSELRAQGVQVHCAKRSHFPTGTVVVSFDGSEPRYEICRPAAWDEIVPSDEAEISAKSADVFCYGTLAARSPRSRSTLEALLKTPGVSKPQIRLLDLNLRPPHFSEEAIAMCLTHADIIKLSEAELGDLGAILRTSSALETLLRRFPASLVCVTAGSRGVTAYQKSGEVLHQPAFPSRGDHPVGAGDAFTAALAVHSAEGHALRDSLREACEYAARVAEAPGAMPLI